MVDLEILAAFGSTNEAIREAMTAVPDAALTVAPARESKADKDLRMKRARELARKMDVRAKLEREIELRGMEGINASLKNWRLYAAVDMAWDSSAITRLTIPLQMYAQGKINVERAAHMLRGVEGGKAFIKEGGTDKPPTIDVPKFVETNVNIIRSIITRRHGAQKNKFNQLWPYYKYEPRSTGVVAKCRADVLSQRVDIMVDQFGYRHHDSQCVREGFLYGHVVDFVRGGWEVEKQYERKDLAQPATKDCNTVITKEGVGFTAPHPSRVFWDNSRPLSALNEDDMEWIGFWDICRFSTVDDDPCYYNKDKVGWRGHTWSTAGIFSTHQEYFSHYQHTIIPPIPGDVNMAAENDRKSMTGLYSSSRRDATVMVTNYFRKLIPKNYGFGEYPWPVWVRFVTASDSTVIFAEILPSTPGAYLGINESDSRLVSVSMAMDLFSAQDQMTNLMTHFLLLCQIEVFKTIGINKDLFSETDLLKIRERLKGRNWGNGDPVILEYSLLKLQESGIKVETAMTILETRQGQSITTIFEAMIKLLEFTEKMHALSPAEQGQPAPREISATEVSEISNTTSSVYSSISEDVDEFRAAKKRIVYESIVACHKGEIICPVKDRYTDKTIIAAGFQPKKGEDEDYIGTAKRFTVIGSKRALQHDYIFTSRDGAERPVNTQAANTLVQLISQVLSVPQIAQAMGKEKLYELFNEVFRLSGAGVDLNLSMKEGEADTLGPDDMTQMKQTVDQMGKYLNQMAGQLQKTTQDVQAQEQINAEQQQAIQGLAGLAKRVEKTAVDVNELHQHKEEVNKKLIESLSYKDAPPSIKRQMEAQAGMVPATEAEHAVELGAMKEAAKPKPVPLKKAA